MHTKMATCRTLSKTQNKKEETFVAFAIHQHQTLTMALTFLLHKLPQMVLKLGLEAINVYKERKRKKNNKTTSKQDL